MLPLTMMSKAMWIIFLLVMKPTHQAIDIDRVVSILAENPVLRLPAPGNRLDDGFRVWERFEKRQDGLPYFDYGFDQAHVEHHEERREAISTSTIAPTTNSTTEAPAKPQGTVIDVTNFACNVLAKHWVCSKHEAPFCVFYAAGVPAAKRIVVTAMTSPINTTSSLDQRLLNFKCSGKLKVSYVSEPVF